MLDTQLEEMYKHTSVSDNTITDLKKQKLEIKDELTKLEKQRRNL